MTNDDAIEAFWASYLRSRPRANKHADSTYYEAFTFGDSERLANPLAQLVLDGTKTATSSLLREYEASDKRPIREGDLCIVLTWDRAPVCVVETTEVRVLPFNRVDAQFVFDYGEGDRTLAWWHRNMWEYYAAECAARGWPASPDMPLVCERFRVVSRGP